MRLSANVIAPVGFFLSQITTNYDGSSLSPTNCNSSQQEEKNDRQIIIKKTQLADS